MKVLLETKFDKIENQQSNGMGERTDNKIWLNTGHNTKREVNGKDLWERICG